jgi:hypothetical protein
MDVYLGGTRAGIEVMILVLTLDLRTRSQFLRQAIKRNLRHYQNVERAIFARIYQMDMS